MVVDVIFVFFQRQFKRQWHLCFEITQTLLGKAAQTPQVFEF